MIDEKTKEKIDEMSQYEMCSIWRFAKDGDPLLSGEVGRYFRHVLFDVKGGFTPEISKSLG